MEILTSLILIVFTFYSLAIVIDYFLVPAVYNLRYKFNWNNDQTGTALSFVSSTPEMSLGFIALYLALAQGQNTASIGPATVVGSGLFSILFIVGLNCWFIKKKLSWPSILRDSLFYIFATVLLLFVVWDSTIYLWEPIILLIAFVGYFLLVIKWDRVLMSLSKKYIFLQKHLEDEEKALGEMEAMEGSEQRNLRKESLNTSNFAGKILSYLFFYIDGKSKIWFFVWNILLSVTFIMILNYIMVEGAVNLATALGIPSVIIALTILGAGTSIPDVLTSLKAAREGMGDAAMVNNIGSPTFDLLVNLGITWLIAGLFAFNKPIPIDTNNLMFSICVLFVATIIMLAILFFQKWRPSKGLAIFLMLIYVGYVAIEILRAVVK